MADSVEYLLILNIQKITKTTTRSGGYNSAETVNKSETEVVKLVLRDEKLHRLIERGTKHMGLVFPNEEVEDNQMIGRPRG